MTVESVIFIALGLLAFGLILKAAAASGSKHKSDKKSQKNLPGQDRQPILKLAGPLPDGFETDLQKFLDSKQLIEAIKYVRTATNLDLRDAKQLVDWVNGGKDLHDLLPGNGNGRGQKASIVKAPIDSSQAYTDAGPTAELQAISDNDAMQRAQILVSKGQVIEAVKVLHEDAGYDLKKATDTVDSLGKRVYPSD